MNRPIDETDRLSGPGDAPRATADSAVRLRLAVALCAAAALAFIAGWPTRFGEFLFGDDRALALDHVFVNHPSWAHAWRLLTMVHSDLYQPLPMLSFQLNYYVCGPDPYGWHLANIALHMLNTVLAGLLAFGLTRSVRVAALSAAMFAVHPLAVESVGWISGRMMLMATAFSLLLLLVFVCRRPSARGTFGVAAVIVWMAALLSKVLPSVPLAAAWCDTFVHGSPLRRRPVRWWIVAAILLLTTVAATLFGIKTTADLKIIEIADAEFTTPAPIRMLLAGRYYLENYFWPSRLSAWAPPPQGLTGRSPPVMVAYAEAALLAAALWLARRHCRTAYIGLGLFVLLLAPFIAAVKARNFLTADRYMYLPMAGLHLAVAGAVVAAIDAVRSRRRGLVWPASATAAIVAVLGCWLVVARAQASIWRNNILQARRGIELNPHEVRLWVELVRSHLFQGSPQEALAAVAEARRQWPDSGGLAHYAGEAYRALGRFDEAERELRRAHSLMPESHRTRYYYGLVLDELGRADEARRLYEGLVAERPNFVPAMTALARNLRKARDPAAALKWYDAAIAENPFHRAALLESADLLMAAGNPSAAIERLRAVLAIDAHDQRARINLAACLAQSGGRDEALGRYEALLQEAPELHAVRLNYAGLLVQLGRTSDAERNYGQVLARVPNDRAAAVGLHMLLQDQQRWDDLIALWTEARARPDAPRQAEAWRRWSLALAGAAGHRVDRDVLSAATTTPAAGDADYLDAFAAALGHHDAVGLEQLAGLPAASTPAAQDELAAIIGGLAVLGAQRPDDRPTLYTSAVALWLRGNAALAARFLDRLEQGDAPADWRALAQTLRARLTNPATSRPGNT